MTAVACEKGSTAASSLPILISETFAKIENRLKNDNSNSLTGDELLELFGLFDDTLERALSIIDKSTVKVYKQQAKNRTIIEVKGSSDCVYRFFPDINYCPCDAYLFQVLKSRCQYTCKHILAAKIALLTNKNIETETLNDTQFDIIAEQLTASLK